MGVRISTIQYSLGYSQSDYAAFNGAVYLTAWMEKVHTCPDGPTYAERYPALYLAVQADHSRVDINGTQYRRGWQVSFREAWDDVPPRGIFSGMSDEDWYELIGDQHAEADLETEVRKYCESIGHEMYVALRKSYEDVTSEEAFIESCEAYEITFEVEED